MNNLQTLLGQIKQRADSATEGPWDAQFVFGSSDLPISVCTADSASTTIVGILEGDCSPQPAHDIRFIAAARTDVPKLLEVIKKLIAQRNHMLSAYDDEHWDRAIKESDAELAAILAKEQK